MWTEADIEAWAIEMRPLSITKTPTIIEACEYFHSHMLKCDVTCPLGHKLSFTPGHFFSLISRSCKQGEKKGMIAHATSAEHAFELIRSGTVKFKDIVGCEPQRVADLPLFLDVIGSPHLIAKRDGGRLAYVKRYEANSKKHRIKVGVLYESGGVLKPASFHTTDLDVDWLNKNAGSVLWKK